MGIDLACDLHDHCSIRDGVSDRLLRISRTTLLQLCAQREHPSQVAQDRSGRISGIRSCTGATRPWAAVVR
ncbi:MAG: hypothetical protein WBJ41_13470 [Chromatiaceae bacterium]